MVKLSFEITEVKIFPGCVVIHDYGPNRPKMLEKLLKVATFLIFGHMMSKVSTEKVNALTPVYSTPKSSKMLKIDSF